MNQGKLEMVKQEMARVNVDILGISELKWTGMGEFNSDDHYIYYCGQESLRPQSTGKEPDTTDKLTHTYTHTHTHTHTENTIFRNSSQVNNQTNK